MVTGNHNRPQGIVLLFVPVFIMLGPVLISPIVGTLFQHFNGQSYARVLVPLLLTAPALCLALCSPIAGKLANRIGGKKVLVGSLAFYGLMGAAPMLVDSLYGMLASRLLLGVAEAGIITGSMVLTAAYFNGDERQKWIAYQRILYRGTKKISRRENEGDKISKILYGRICRFNACSSYLYVSNSELNF